MTAGTITLFDTFLMVSLIIFWGSSFVVVKIALDEGLTPISIATFRFLIAGALFLIALILNKTRRADYHILAEPKDMITLLILSLTGVTLFFMAQYTGIKMANASTAAIFVCLLSPIIITILSKTMLQEYLTNHQILGSIIAAGGTFAVIVGGTPTFSGSREFFLGSLILLSTPFLWATYSLLGKKIMKKYSPFLTTAYVTILGGLCLIPFCLVEDSFHKIFSMTCTSWVAILFLSLTCSLLGYYIWLHVLKQVGPAVTSSFLFAEPLVTVLFAVVFIGEKLNLLILSGGLLIFLGVCLVATKQRSEPSQ